MGILKTSKTVAGKIVTGPLAYLYPKASQKRTEQILNYKNNVESIYCPRCGESYLKLLDAEDTPETIKETAFYVAEDIPPNSLVYWACPECFLGIAASAEGIKPKHTIDQVREFVRECSDEIYNEIAPFDEEEIDERVQNHMRVSYLYFGVTFLLILLMVTGLVKGSFSFVIPLTLFIATSALIALKWSYRAWQVRNDKLFAENPKEQFLDWISSNNPFKTPY